MRCIGDVGNDGRGKCTKLLGQLSDPLVPARDENDVHALLYQEPGRGFSDPARGTGDDGDLPAEFLHFHDVCIPLTLCCLALRQSASASDPGLEVYGTPLHGTDVGA
ncbi:hypothetical protein GCM10007301_22740 [Azorhizobium oxalatiphilum]|uniref:Uncharacterized protein n=1 Tax=Azorhizobium oxalatiphilum TaxID=980631 RepID=A0A917FB69_9HYPH|nr:hypothetical protein GCM10007301_22740 [Azorhizobium oxalatiphilum]